MSQAAQTRGSSWTGLVRWFYVGIVATLLVLAVALQSIWVPWLQRLVPPSAGGTTASQEGAEDHASHDHGHAGHDEANSIELSEQGRKNIGLTLAKVELRPFVRTITVPGMIVEKPGQSTIAATAPLTGIVTRVHVIEGAAVVPGDPMFDIRLTHEELVQAQADLLKTAEELRVTEREIQRLEAITADGAIPRKTLIERQYEQQKQQAALRSQQQALRLHGLSEEQIAGILENGKLVAELTVRAPTPTGAAADEVMLQITDLRVTQGQNVTAGDTLAVLANHAELFIEGNAFESDLPSITRASDEGWPISAKVEGESESVRRIEDLQMLYVASKVDPESRTLHFYLRLPNEKQRDATTPDGRRFIGWRFRPGQRVQIQIPVERWEDRIVLPLAAVAQDGVETYVFTPNGDHFDRRPVHVEYQDTDWAVIANDGSIFPGTPVAISGAQQLQIALKNQAGGAIDPHAGHTH